MRTRGDHRDYMREWQRRQRALARAAAPRTVRVSERGLASLLRAGAVKNQTYTTHKYPDGSILLTPINQGDQ